MKFLMKEFGNILAMIAAIILSPLLILGVPYNIIKPLVDNFGIGILNGVFAWFYWIGHVLYQVWVVVKQTALFIGYIIDLLGNALVGEIIEDIVTHKENTLFGKGDCTISAALGQLKMDGHLNKVGLWFCDVLSALDPDHEDHCIAAIKKRHYRDSLKVK